MPASVSMGSLHLQEHRAATFSTMAGGVGGVHNQTYYNSHIRVSPKTPGKLLYTRIYKEGNGVS